MNRTLQLSFVLAAKLFGALFLAVVVFVASLAIAFTLTPEFTVNARQLRFLGGYFLPDSVRVEFGDADLRIVRLRGFWLAKAIEFNARDLCVRWEGEAARACFATTRLAVALGWAGQGKIATDESARTGQTKRTWGVARFLPKLISIDPIVLLGGDLDIDVTAISKSGKEQGKKKKSEPAAGQGFANFLRQKILPKWKIEGSRIEIAKLRLKTASDVFRSRFDLATLENGGVIQATLHEFRSEAGDPRIKGVIRLTRPENKEAWRLVAEGEAGFKGASSVGFFVDSEIFSWEAFDFRILAKFKKFMSLRQARLAGGLRGSRLGGVFSMKMGAMENEIRSFDLINCAIDADLDRKAGGVGCGPRTVKLRVREHSLLQNPGLFTLRPEFTLRVNRLEFENERSAEFSFHLALDHRGIARVKSAIEGRVSDGEANGLRYEVEGGVEVVVARFQRLAAMLRRTPFAIPAPLNGLDGPIVSRVQGRMTHEGGRVSYEFVPRLDSQHQSVHLRISGTTDLIGKDPRAGKGFEPATDVTILIDRLRIAAPRFELGLPPQLHLDPRFGSIAAEERRRTDGEGRKSEPMDFRMAIRTARSQAIRIATNLTREPIPIDLDLVYGERVPQRPSPREREKAAPRAPASISPATVPVIRAESEERGKEGNNPMKEGNKPVITGSVVIGRTPIELFRRNAQLERLRVNLLASGRQKLDGQVEIRYLDYVISVLLLGDVSEPQVKLASQPPLDDNQILSVLLFGRPLNELSEDEQSSVSSVNAAFADAALGITSLYLLANTPIESVGYDPERRMVTAKVDLGGGASLELGGGDDRSGVGLRKRISREFLLRSDVERLGATGKRTVSAFLEWARRF